MKPREWLCLLRFGHKWQRVVSGDVSYFRCVRCGKERAPYAMHTGPPLQ